MSQLLSQDNIFVLGQQILVQYYNEHDRAYEIDASSKISANNMVLLTMVYGGIWTPVRPAVIAYLAMCAAK